MKHATNRLVGQSSRSVFLVCKCSSFKMSSWFVPVKSSNWYKSSEGVRQNLLDIMGVSLYQKVSETLLWTTGSPQNISLSAWSLPCSSLRTVAQRSRLSCLHNVETSKWSEVARRAPLNSANCHVATTLLPGAKHLLWINSELRFRLTLPAPCRVLT
jgi:hypothetical protein